MLGLRDLSRAERPLMPAHGDVGTGDLTGAYRHQIAGKPVLQIIFIVLIYADGVGNQVGFTRIAPPQSGNDDGTLGLEMTCPLSAPKMDQEILIRGIVPGPQIPREEPMTGQASLYSFQKTAEILYDRKAVNIHCEPPESLLRLFDVKK